MAAPTHTREERERERPRAREMRERNQRRHSQRRRQLGHECSMAAAAWFWQLGSSVGLRFESRNTFGSGETPVLVSFS
ncbi:hypothetical protein Hdeb2414_s0006g00205171 [Helianthus debilis subsp. tardiflorus]